MNNSNVDQLTFKSFIEYLVEMPIRKFDVHWLPIYLTCKPCLISYDFIAKTETMEEDGKAILKKIGVNRTITTVNAASGGNTQDKIREYYSDFDRELLRKLYKIYEMDFILFDYSPDEYFRNAIS